MFTSAFQFCCATFFIKLFARSSSMSFFLSRDGKCKWASTLRDVDFSQRLESISLTRSGNSSATLLQYCCAFPNKSGRFAPRFCPVSFDALSLSAFLLFSLLKPGLDFEHLLNLSVSSFSFTALSWKFWLGTFKFSSTKMKLDEAFLILSAHFGQTREDKFETQVRNSFSFEDSISLRGLPSLDVVNKFSEQM